MDKDGQRDFVIYTLSSKFIKRIKNKVRNIKDTCAFKRSWFDFSSCGWIEDTGLKISMHWLIPVQTMGYD